MQLAQQVFYFIFLVLRKLYPHLIKVFTLKNFIINKNLIKGKLVERRGRKAMGLKPQGYDCQVAKSRNCISACFATALRAFLYICNFEQRS